jgi:hypothetical protein
VSTGATNQPSPQDRVFAWLTALSVTALLLANVLGVKLFAFEVELPLLGRVPVQHTAGMLTFPVTFILTDVLNEHYGARGARRVIWISFGMGALAVPAIWAAQALPPAPAGLVAEAAFDRVLGGSRVMYVASLVAYLSASMLDVVVFRLFRWLTGGRYLGLRATGSTVVSQLFDSFVVTSILFWSLGRLDDGTPVTWGFVLQTTVTGYVLKFVLAVLATPLVYLAHAIVRRLLRGDGASAGAIEDSRR